MKERICEHCDAINEIEFTLRAGNTSAITIRCKGCKRLLQIEGEKEEARV
ncbi:MAG: hypothetical protein Q7K39_04610 [Candidatus Magasanikbacteria bacterium]|nr:hypothetical protein [Candidatus Magasanikbacteria bacterium]